mmetsp:Transcript_26485/g.54219  ORF Transcript_26485/g.54219 Transcript_26485/m.54219 type:complete len:443 (+) Transcript_26485:64-1392(+)
MTAAPVDPDVAALVLDLQELAPLKPLLHHTPLVEMELAEAAAGEAEAIAEGLEATPVPFEVFPVLANELAARPSHVLAPVGIGPGCPAGTRRANPNELLRTAARTGALKAVAELLDKGVRPDKLSPTSGYNALHYAACFGHSSVCLALVKRGKACVESVTSGAEGKTALLLAASNGHAECVFTLVRQCGANVEARDRCFGWVPLIWSAVGGHARTSGSLLRCGAFKEAKAETKFDPVRRGMTALEAAEAMMEKGDMKSHEETVKLLRGWEVVLAAEGLLALERQDEADSLRGMEQEEAASWAVETRLRAIAAVKAKGEAELNDQKLAEEKIERAHNRDLRRLTEERAGVEELLEEAKEAEDWDRLEELDDELKAIPTTVEGYRERIVRRKEEAAAAAAEAEEGERWGMLDEDEREDNAQYEDEEEEGVEGGKEEGGEQEGRV